jgi:hypothetical protein
MEYPDDKFVFTKEWFEAAAKLAEENFKKPKTFRIICHPDDKELYERILRGEL